MIRVDLYLKNFVFDRFYMKDFSGNWREFFSFYSCIEIGGELKMFGYCVV